MLYLNDALYDNIEDFVDRELSDLSEEAIMDYYPNGVTFVECSEKPVHQFTKDNMIDALFNSIEDNIWPDEGDETEALAREAIGRAIKEIDIQELNEEMPRVWVANGRERQYSMKYLLKLNKEINEFD